MPIWIRIFFFFAPVYALYLLLFGTRSLIANNLATDDLASRDEVVNYDDDLAKMDSLVIDERDRVLIEKIENLRNQKYDEPKLVAIVY